MFNLFSAFLYLCWLLIPSRCDSGPHCARLTGHPWVTMLGSPSHWLTTSTVPAQWSPGPHITAQSYSNKVRYNTNYPPSSWPGETWCVIFYQEERSAHVKWRQYNTPVVSWTSDCLQCDQTDWLSEIRNIWRNEILVFYQGAAQPTRQWSTGGWCDVIQNIQHWVKTCSAAQHIAEITIVNIQKHIKVSRLVGPFLD